MERSKVRIEYLKRTVVAENSIPFELRRQVRIRDSQMGEGGAAYVAATQGSVHVAETRGSSSVSVAYRAAAGKACFAAASGDANSSFAEGAQGMRACSEQAATSHYDADVNGRVTQGEFADGLQRLALCLGGDCPHVSRPASAVQQVFGLDDGTSLPQLALADFLQRLWATNATEHARRFGVPTFFRKRERE